MGWFTDLMKDVPTLAVARERMALANDKFEVIEEKLRVRDEEVEQLREKCRELEEQLGVKSAGEEFVKSKGVLWMKEGAGFETSPYCPQCKTPMHAFPPYGKGMYWMCSACKLKVNHCESPSC